MTKGVIFMKALLVYAHPNPKSFNHAVLEAVKEEFAAAGVAFDVRDLYALSMDPVLKAEDFLAIREGKPLADVAKEQRFVKEADLLVVIHPVWWFSLPAILKGWIDRVFSAGFAYAYGKNGPEGLLKGKKVALFSTTGGSEKDYDTYGFKGAIRTAVDNGIFGFCGMEVILHHFMHAVPAVSQEEREAMLVQVRHLVREQLLSA